MTIPDPASPPAASLPQRLTRWHACLLIILIWAAIYLPTLGSLEIKGEEGRRILPAVAMLQTDRWVLPSIGGVDYLSKPPLINWLAAAAFKLTGTRSEWAARAPSALSVLALGLATVWALSRVLTPTGAVTAAVFMLTNIGLMEKGRLAEIEALYISLYGLALLTWLDGWWSGNTAPWRTWALPGLFLGLGLLTKGPLNLFFYYAVVLAVLACDGRLRELWNWQHLAGLFLTGLIFLAWAYPYWQETATGRAGTVWRAQIQGRLEINEGFHFSQWLLNIPRGLGNYLPWIVLVPLLWTTRKDAVVPPLVNTDGAVARSGPILRGGALAVLACFLSISLAPGGVPRYTLPLLVPLSILLAMVLVQKAASVPPLVLAIWSRIVVPLLFLATLGAWPAAAAGGAELWQWGVAFLIFAAGLFFLVEHCRFRNWGGAPVLALSSAGVMALITADFSLGAIPHMRHEENVRTLAQKINRITNPSGESVHVLSPGFLPFLFYLRPEPVYIQNPVDLPGGTLYLLVRDDDLAKTTEQLKKSGRPSQISRRLDDKNRGRWDLLRVEGTSSGSL